MTTKCAPSVKSIIQTHVAKVFFYCAANGMEAPKAIWMINNVPYTSRNVPYLKSIDALQTKRIVPIKAAKEPTCVRKLSSFNAGFE